MRGGQASLRSFDPPPSRLYCSPMQRARGDECVFAVHGFLGSPLEFFLIKNRLRDAGYEVRLWGHGSITRPIHQYAEVLANTIAETLMRNEFTKVHLLGHSMGGIIVRAAIVKLNQLIPPTQRGRAVLLAAPNRGSPVASFFAGKLGGLIPAVADLAEGPNSYVNSLPNDCGWEIGTIWTPYDHLVPEKSARMDGAAADAMVTGMHTGLLLKSDVAKMTISFLDNGRFS